MRATRLELGSHFAAFCLAALASAEMIHAAGMVSPASERDSGNGRAPGAQDSALVQAAQKGQLAERFLTYARIKQGMPAPGVTATHWYNTAQPVEPGESVLLVSFWSMSCRPCVEQMPLLHDLADRHRPHLKVVTVHPSVQAETIQQWLRSHDVTLPVAIDTGLTRKDYGVTGAPTYFLIDRAGKVLLKTHRLPSQSVLHSAIDVGVDERPSALAAIARRKVPGGRSITIDPTTPGDTFATIKASRWFNSPPLSSLRGRVLLIDFWATWCGPCLDTLPVVQSYARQFGSALTVIGVHYGPTDEKVVERFIRKHDVSFPVALDTGETWKMYSIRYAPTYLLVDRSGVVRFIGRTPPEMSAIAELISSRTPR